MFQWAEFLPVAISLKPIEGQAVNIETVEQNVFDIKQVDELVEPFNEQIVSALAPYFQTKAQFLSNAALCLLYTSPSPRDRS